MPKTIVITGASDGIGAAAARELHALGHEVVVVGRSAEKTRAVAEALGVQHHVADFTRLDDVEALAAALRAAHPRIDVLANNAGGIFGDPTRTVDGFERTFQINHLAPFLLTRLLLPDLLAARATVVQTSSIASRLMGRLDLADLQHERDFDPQLAYGTVKLENILFTTELHRRFHDQGLNAAAFHPGVVATSFSAGSTSPMRLLYSFAPARAFMTTPAKGARTLVRCATGVPGTDWVPGEYYENDRPARRRNPQALDAALARGLWEASETLLAARLG